MCGIVGTIRVGDSHLVERMSEIIAYRGPDDFGYYEDDDVRLGHRRLSILDLSTAGHQPMQTDDGQLVIVYNGETYNFRELRDELEGAGHHFHTGTDTEVILHAYRAWGRDCLGKLEGMFAFALWDRRKGELLLARDRLGIKPLFYCERGDGLAFASELKPLLLLPGLERNVNRRALRSAIRYGSNLEDESMLASVRKLPPAHFLVWRDGVCDVQPYWQHPHPAPTAWDEATVTAELRDRLRQVVRAHMISDAPLGAALSGGLDSSGIVALMAESSPRPIDTFTVGHGTDDPDIQAARLVAAHWRTNHHEIAVEAENIADLLPRVVWHLEEPLGQMETVQMFINYRAAARFVKVLLIGEGADELFGGYARYKVFEPHLPLPLSVRKDLYRRVYQHSDEPMATAAGRVLTRWLWGKPPISPLPDTYPRALPPLDDVSERAHAVERAMNYDQRTILPHLYLKRADAMGMAHSLELRVPFLDRQIVELAARIPGSLMVRGGVEKYILRRALAPLLPPAIIRRRKHPLQMRVNTGLVETLDYLCDKLLKAADVKARGFFEPERVARLRRERPGRFATHTERKFWAWRVWSMILCELWARMFLDRLPTPTPPMCLADVL
jgi:asparagine synthase (glutamine-hydrolysing)